MGGRLWQEEWAKEGSARVEVSLQGASNRVLERLFLPGWKGVTSDREETVIIPENYNCCWLLGLTLSRKEAGQPFGKWQVGEKSVDLKLDLDLGNVRVVLYANKQKIEKFINSSPFSLLTNNKIAIGHSIPKSPNKKKG